jgi:hypothetical protein
MQPTNAAELHPLQAIEGPDQRVDFLAGLVATACICVSLYHFLLTFLPYVEGYGPADEVEHYRSEYWAQQIVGQFFLTPIWLGAFFTTSARFLAARYLREGHLYDIARKTLLRVPRILTPIAIIASLQYFFIEMGFTYHLEWLPSVTWSSWPYVVPFPNFGDFITQLLELAFLPLNAAPQIVLHYCVGVLWTIPVQLQNSYLVLLGATMVRDIKKPWKRMAFYLFCIVNHWYAFSWGSLFWLGLLLADLEVTYKYSKWVQARWYVHYPLLTTLFLLGSACTSTYYLQDHLGIPIFNGEAGILPDQETGLPRSQTPRAGIPTYYEPRLIFLVFAGCVQMTVELSSWIRRFLSLKVLAKWVFPHIMTIYLVHGFVFWTLGAWLCITLTTEGLPYWATIFVVWIVCYATIFLAAMVLTPLTTLSTIGVSRNVWRWATEEAVPKRATLVPFTKDLLLDTSRICARDVENRQATANRSDAGSRNGQVMVQAKEE